MGNEQKTNQLRSLLHELDFEVIANEVLLRFAYQIIQEEGNIDISGEFEIEGINLKIELQSRLTKTK